MLKTLTRIKRSVVHVVKYWISSVIVILSGKRSTSNDRLRSFKNKYEGRRCFIIGNGPSLTKEDLELLRNEVTFASNRIHKMFACTDWRPTFYAVFDETVTADADVIRNVNTFDCQGKFFREQAWLINRQYRDGIYIHSWHDRKYLQQPQFSKDLTKGIYTIATVTYALIQIARYMGFSEIYLIGVDHKYANERKKDGSVVKNEGVKSYFGNQQKLETSVVAASWEMECAYQYAEDYSRQNGFRIFNATRGGYLEVFERVELETVVHRMG